MLGCIFNDLTIWGNRFGEFCVVTWLAIDHFTRSIRINPLDPIIGQVRSGLGAALLMSGRIEEGVEALEQALHEAPEYTASWLVLAIAYWELGRVDEARRFGQKLLAREPGTTVSKYIRDSPC